MKEFLCLLLAILGTILFFLGYRLIVWANNEKNAKGFIFFSTAISVLGFFIAVYGFQNYVTTIQEDMIAQYSDQLTSGKITDLSITHQDSNKYFVTISQEYHRLLLKKTFEVAYEVFESCHVGEEVIIEFSPYEKIKIIKTLEQR